MPILAMRLSGVEVPLSPHRILHVLLVSLGTKMTKAYALSVVTLMTNLFACRNREVRLLPNNVRDFDASSSKPQNRITSTVLAIPMPATASLLKDSRVSAFQPALRTPGIARSCEQSPLFCRPWGPGLSTWDILPLGIRLEPRNPIMPLNAHESLPVRVEYVRVISPAESEEVWEGRAGD